MTEESLTDARPDLLKFNKAVLSILVALLVLLGLAVCWPQATDNPRIWSLFLVAAGSTAFGAFVGFLYSTIGQETERFKELSGIATGIFGGAATADVALNDDGLVRSSLNALADGCGWTGMAALTGVIVMTFGVTGFLLFYFNRKLWLNILTANAEKTLVRAMRESLERSVDAELESSEIRETGTVQRTQAPMAKVLINELNFKNVTNVSDLVSAAKAFYAADDLSKAAQFAEKALEQEADNREALLLAARTWIARNNPGKALTFLERLRPHAEQEPFIYKLLGYACLWDRQNITKSAAASNRYLELVPGDVGAKLNLACAYGQMGFADKENVERTLALVRELTANPDLKLRLRSLSAPGEDFEGWSTNVPEFHRLVMT